MNKERKIYWAIIGLIRVSLVFAFFFALYRLDYITLFISLVTLFLTFIPDMFEKRYKIDIPLEFEIVTVVFIFATLFLGEVHSFYTLFWWWDIILHMCSALAFGFIGFMTMYTLYQDQKFYGSNFMIALFSFAFAVMIGSLWEIFEFSMDQIFGLNMQKSGLVDTMGDLIVDVIGAGIAAFTGFFYLRRGDAPFFGKTMKRFKESNPHFFEKKENRRKRRKLRRELKKDVRAARKALKESK